MPVDYPTSLPWLQPPSAASIQSAQLQREQMAMRMFQENQQLQLQRERMDQTVMLQDRQLRQQAEMQKERLAMTHQAQQERLQQEANIAAHRLQVQKAYNDATTGLRQVQLQQGADKLKLEYGREAQKFAEQQKMEQIVQDLVDKGASREEAVRQAMLEYGPALRQPPALYNAAVRNSERLNANKVTGRMVPVEGTDMQVPILESPGRWQVAPPQSGGPATMTPAPFGMLEIKQNGKVRYQRRPDFKFAEQETLETLRAADQRAGPGTESYNSASKAVKAAADERHKRLLALEQKYEEELRKFESGGERITPPTSGTATNKTYRWTPSGLTPR